MSLWIRSQDRESIFEVQNVFYSTDNETKHLIRTVVANNIPKGIIELGQYSTKERVLEILDEIQNIFSLRIKNMSYDEADLFLKAKMLDGCYEMPEE